jgi:hypothetical protein
MGFHDGLCSANFFCVGDIEMGSGEFKWMQKAYRLAASPWPRPGQRTCSATETALALLSADRISN